MNLGHLGPLANTIQLKLLFSAGYRKCTSQGVYRTLKTLNSENQTLKTLKTLYDLIFRGKTLKMTIFQFQKEKNAQGRDFVSGQ